VRPSVDEHAIFAAIEEQRRVLTEAYDRSKAARRAAAQRCAKVSSTRQRARSLSLRRCLRIELLAGHSCVAIPKSYGDAFNLIERNLIASAVVELRGPRTFVRGHGLGVLQRATGVEISSDAGRTKRVIADMHD
jgi:hypothetical protein